MGCGGFCPPSLPHTGSDVVEWLVQKFCISKEGEGEGEGGPCLGWGGQAWLSTHSCPPPLQRPCTWAPS